MRLPSTFQQTRFSGFGVYNAYLALGLHFKKDSYNVFKYGGRTNASEKAYETRKDRYNFEKLARHKDPIGILVSHMVINPSAWIGTIQAESEIYRLWKARQESLTYSIGESIKRLSNDNDSIDYWLSAEGGNPRLYRMLLAEAIDIETVCALQLHLNFIPHWDEHMKDNPAWEDSKRRLIVKYLPFLELNSEKIGSLIDEQFVEFG